MVIVTTENGDSNIGGLLRRRKKMIRDCERGLAVSWVRFVQFLPVYFCERVRTEINDGEYW